MPDIIKLLEELLGLTDEDYINRNKKAMIRDLYRVSDSGWLNSGEDSQTRHITYTRQPLEFIVKHYPSYDAKSTAYLGDMKTKFDTLFNAIVSLGSSWPREFAINESITNLERGSRFVGSPGSWAAAKTAEYALAARTFGPTKGPALTFGKDLLTTLLFDAPQWAEEIAGKHIDSYFDRSKFTGNETLKHLEKTIGLENIYKLGEESVTKLARKTKQDFDQIEDIIQKQAWSKEGKNYLGGNETYQRAKKDMFEMHQFLIQFRDSDFFYSAKKKAKEWDKTHPDEVLQTYVREKPPFVKERSFDPSKYEITGGQAVPYFPYETANSYFGIKAFNDILKTNFGSVFPLGVPFLNEPKTNNTAEVKEKHNQMNPIRPMSSYGIFHSEGDSIPRMKESTTAIKENAEATKNLVEEKQNLASSQEVINSLLADSATAADKSTEAIITMTAAQYWQQQNAALAEYVDELLHHNEVIKVTQADWNALKVKVKVEDFESPDLIDEEDWAEAIQEEYNAHYIPFPIYINNDMDVAPYNNSNKSHYLSNETLDRCKAAA